MLNLALAQELASTASHFGRTWCYPSQDTLLEKLSRWHGQHISQRTLNRHLAALEAAGWIRRQCRHQTNPQGTWTFRSTLYVILKPCQRALRRLTAAVAYFRRFSRVPHMANNGTTSLLKSCPGAPSSPPDYDKKVSANRFAAEARKLLAR